MGLAQEEEGQEVRYQGQDQCRHLQAHLDRQPLPHEYQDRQDQPQLLRRQQPRHQRLKKVD